METDDEVSYDEAVDKLMEMSDDEIIQKAVEDYPSPRIGIDLTPKLLPGNGCTWVQAWVWVETPGVKLSLKTPKKVET